jgi:methyl-accepting chemotaxis protein
MSTPPRRRWSTWLDDLPVAAKLLGAAVTAVALAAVVGILGLTALGSTHQATTDMYGHNLAGTKEIAAAQLAMSQSQLAVVSHVSSMDLSYKQQYADQFAAHAKEFDAELAAYARDTRTGRTAQVKQLRDEFAAFAGVVTAKAFPLSVANDMRGYYAIGDSYLTPHMQHIQKMLGELSAAETAAAKTAVDDAQHRYDVTRTAQLILLVAGAVLVLLLSFAVARSLTRRIRRVQGVAEALAEGDLTVATELTARDEVGRMAAALDGARASLRTVLSSVVASADAVAASSEELSASSAQISASAEETSAQSGIVSSAAEEVSRSVQTVAAGADQMGASIREIASNATQASEVATRAVEAAASTSATIAKLGDSSAEIGNVVKVITSIAEQTNLLALNATIEAARAGEAGKGFAVVANEVKELAQETAKATEDIARRVEAIQHDTGAAVTAIGEISDIVAQISDRQATIASAVEEQTATTNEMSRSVKEAAGGTGEIASNITGVSTAAESTTQALAQTRTAVDELSRMATDLRTTVGRFTY